MITASKVQLAVLCGHSFREDVRATHPITESSDAAKKAADLGTEVHAMIAAAIRGEVYAAKTSANAKKYFNAWLDAREQFASFTRAEIAYAINPAENFAIECEVVDRDYPDHGAGWLYGTADAVHVADGVGHVIDWKTGSTAPTSRHNAQLYTLACALALVHRIDRANVSIVHVRPGGVHVDTTALDRVDLDAWLDTLAETMVRLPSAPATPGAHCDALWCEIRGSCRARVQTDGFEEDQ